MGFAFGMHETQIDVAIVLEFRMYDRCKQRHTTARNSRRVEGKIGFRCVRVFRKRKDAASDF